MKELELEFGMKSGFQLRMNKPKTIGALLFCALIVLSGMRTVKAQEITGVVTISIIIDKAEYFDQLYLWLQSIRGFNQFVFVIDDYFASDYILDNATRVAILKSYGEVIPRLPYMQQNTTAQREAWIDDVTNRYTKALGYPPQGLMDFVPDTFSADYALSKGYTYIQGYCFDQYAVDAISERGGWQLPYYASPSNILVPNSQSSGIVVLPHATCDWIDGYTVSQNLQLHPVNIEAFFDNNTAKAKSYFLNLINNCLQSSSPFGLANIQFEWSSCEEVNMPSIIIDWIKSALNHQGISAPYRLMTYSQLVKWFKQTYTTTPTYRVDFTSPYSGNSIEWYYCTNYRIARVGSYVVSLVNYTIQSPDKYLNQTQPINWSGPMDFDPSNRIDDSLKFSIDAFGGGIHTFPNINYHKTYYTGNLDDFQGPTSNSSANTIELLIPILSPIVFIIAILNLVRVHNKESKTDKLKRAR